MHPQRFLDSFIPQSSGGNVEIMQSIWSRAAPSQTTGRFVTYVRPTVNRIASRAGTPVSRRRLRIGNSVTALYSSIFAAAALADARVKGQRRRELEEKIAAVKEEVDELVNEEQRLLEALGSRRERHTSNWSLLQLRQYSTSASLPPAAEQPNLRNEWPSPSLSDRIPTVEVPADQGPDPNTSASVPPVEEEPHLRNERASPSLAGEVPKDEVRTNEDLDSNRPASVPPVEYEPHLRNERESPFPGDEVPANKDLHPNNSLDAVAEAEAELTHDAEHDEERLFDESDDWAPVPWKGPRLKAIQKLAVKQLAIRLLLRPVIAQAYLGVAIDHVPDFELPRLKTSQLLAEAEALRRRINYLKRSPNANYDDLVTHMGSRDFKSMTAEVQSLDEELERDIELYQSNRMSLPEVLLRLSHNLIASGEPDRPAAFRAMILAFTKTRQNDIVDLILRALLPNAFLLNSALILTILSYLRKAKNLKDFDMFLQMLRGEAGYKPNLGQLSYYKQKVVNGIEITVPPMKSNNYLIWTSLVMAALRFDQPDRADAWLQAARAHGFMDNPSTLFCYLRFYAIRRDWTRGVHTLRRSLAFIASSSDHEERRIERLIAVMVYLCDRCEKHEFSAALIDAAAQSGFDWKIAEMQLDLVFPFDPTYQRWKEAAELWNSETQHRDTWEKCYSFTKIVGEQMNRLLASEEEKTAKREEMNGMYAEISLSAILASNNEKSRSLGPDGEGPPLCFCSIKFYLQKKS